MMAIPTSSLRSIASHLLPPRPPLSSSPSRLEGRLAFHIRSPVPDAGIRLENLAGPHLSRLRAPSCQQNHRSRDRHTSTIPSVASSHPAMARKPPFVLRVPHPPVHPWEQSHRYHWLRGTSRSCHSLDHQVRLRSSLRLCSNPTKLQTATTCASRTSTRTSGSVTTRPSHLSVLEKISITPRSPLPQRTSETSCNIVANQSEAFKTARIERV